VTMTIVLLVLVCLLGVVVFVQMGALIELFRQVQQIRNHLDLVDRPTPIDLGRAQGAAASTVGLPAGLDDASAAMVLFLSNKCATCHAIAASLSHAIPANMWIVVEPLVAEEGESFVKAFRLGGERTIVDQGGRIADRLGLDITPSAIFVESGRLKRAETVPSTRQLFSMLPAVHRLQPTVPDESLASSP